MAGSGGFQLIFVSTVLTCSLFSRFTCSFQVTILDTTNTESLDWVTYFRGEGHGRGWREASYTNEEGDVLRVYAVCNVATTTVDSWLRTPFISTAGVNRLYVEIRFSMRKCTKYPHPGRLQQCKESFKLLYYESDDDDVTDPEVPAWDEGAYRHVDVIAADKIFTELNRANVNSETRSIPVTRRGLYFAFFDQGACVSLLSIRVFYVVCPSVTLNFAVFANTTTGPHLTSIVQREGACVKHAVVDQLPSYLCKADGNWYFLTGACKCLPGYQPSDYPETVRCQKCPLQTYKWQASNELCQQCPENSMVVETGATECVCEKDFYRSSQDDKSLPCTRPPAKVQNLTFVYRDQTSVVLTWEPPLDLGGRRDIEYGIECVNCSDKVAYSPRRAGFNSTRASLTGLTPGSSYHVIVYAENGVSRQSGATRETADIIVCTDIAVPTKISDLRITSVGTEFVALAWNSPISHMSIDIYEVKYWKNDDLDDFMSNYTLSNNITLHNMLQRTRYSFQVRGKTAKGWGEYSDIIYGTTGHVSHFPADNPIGIIVGFSVSIVICMLIVIVFFAVFVRRNSRIDRKKSVSDCDKLHSSGGQCSLGLDRTLILDGGLTMPLFVPPGAVQTYVDPHTYEDPSQAVREFTKEIDASSIMIEAVIGGGEFGDVCKGRMRLPGSDDLIVAIKTLKAGTSDKNRLDFLTEASIMGQFDHPNVIYLEGVVTRSNPIMIVTEFMENGSLDSFLRNNDGKFTIVQLVGMIRGISSGMSYLSEMGYIHRDLAARNILVNENLVCKVSDFGLSRELESDASDGVYTTKGGKIPVRWTAPEAIIYRKFTSSSDVWSFGVVTWEVMSYGERPYWNWSNQDVIKALDNGYRLPPPMDCPEAVYQLMLDCWQEVRSQRPKFSSVVNTIDRLIRCPELLRKIATPRPNDSLVLSCADNDSYDSVEDWLKDIKMQRYLENFEKCGFTTMDEVMHITHKDLLRLDVNLIGHQKKILNSVQALRATIRSTEAQDLLV